MGGVVDHGFVAHIWQHFFFECRRQNAHANRFAQNQDIAHFGIGIAFNVIGVCQSQGDQAIDGFNRINGVAACNGNPSGSTDALSTIQNLSNHAQGQDIDGHAHQSQSHDGLCTHGIHIGDGIGGGNAAKFKRIVHDGHEEVCGGNQGLVLIQLVNGRVVSRFNAHQQFGGERHGGGRAQNFAQDARRNFAAATAAMRKAGESRAGFEGFSHAVVHS